MTQTFFYLDILEGMVFYNETQCIDFSLRGQIKKYSFERVGERLDDIHQAYTHLLEVAELDSTTQL